MRAFTDLNLSTHLFVQRTYTPTVCLQVEILLGDLNLLGTYDLFVMVDLLMVISGWHGTKHICCPTLMVELTHRAGKDLVALYRSSAVQAYINGLSSQELYPEKGIYQHAALRKVSTHLKCSSAVEPL